MDEIDRRLRKATDMLPDQDLHPAPELLFQRLAAAIACRQQLTQALLYQSHQIGVFAGGVAMNSAKTFLFTRTQDLPGAHRLV